MPTTVRPSDRRLGFRPFLVTLERTLAGEGQRGA
jgi:hypothetical protein